MVITSFLSKQPFNIYLYCEIQITIITIIITIIIIITTTSFLAKQPFNICVCYEIQIMMMIIIIIPRLGNRGVLSHATKDPL